MTETWWQRTKREEAEASLRDNFGSLQKEAESLPFDEQNRRYQELGKALLGDSYNASEYRWTAMNPNPAACSCYEWQRYPIPQRHFGFANYCVCGICKCSCHVGQIWLASVDHGEPSQANQSYPSQYECGADPLLKSHVLRE